eukprot:15431035-Alexandrium_andersonii.AAC.1
MPLARLVPYAFARPSHDPAEHPHLLRVTPSWARVSPSPWWTCAPVSPSCTSPTPRLSPVLRSHRH